MDKIEFTREEVNQIGNLLGEFPAKHVYWALNLCITKIQEFDLAKGKKDPKAVTLNKEN